MKNFNYEESNRIMDEFDSFFKFCKNGWGFNKWFDFTNRQYVGYRLPENCLDNDEWYENMNTLVNSVVKEDMYVIDWNHSVEIKEKDEKVGYFPDGDHYFFVTKNFDYAILTVFVSENEHYIFFVGEELVKKVIKQKEKLGLKTVKI